jgi:cell division protein FtsB
MLYSSGADRPVQRTLACSPNEQGLSIFPARFFNILCGAATTCRRLLDWRKKKVPATAACLVETPFEEGLSEDSGRSNRGLNPGARPAQAPPVRRRYHVSTRKPAARRQRETARTSLTGAVIFWILPVLGLLFYVSCSTLAITGAYYRDQLHSEIAALQVERMDLEAEKRRLQSPRLILRRAAVELGMTPAGDREYGRLPAEARVAREAPR